MRSSWIQDEVVLVEDGGVLLEDDVVVLKDERGSAEDERIFPKDERVFTEDEGGSAEDERDLPKDDGGSAEGERDLREDEGGSAKDERGLLEDDGGSTEGARVLRMGDAVLLEDEVALADRALALVLTSRRASVRFLPDPFLRGHMKRFSLSLFMLCALSFIGVRGCFDDYGNLWAGYSSSSSSGDNGCGMPQGQGGAGFGGAGMGGADLSAQAATAASSTMRDMPQGVFCSLLASTMTAWFVSTQPLLGARVTKVAQ